MLLTRETDYALRILRALSDGERHTAGELAGTQQVPQQFTYKILKKLQKAKLVNVIRGADGGCALAVSLDAASLYDVMRATGGDDLVNACMEPGHVCAWRAARDGVCCGIHCRLADIQEKLNAELKSHSLRELFFGS